MLLDLEEDFFVTVFSWVSGRVPVVSLGCPTVYSQSNHSKLLAP